MDMLLASLSLPPSKGSIVLQESQFPNSSVQLHSFYYNYSFPTIVWV